MKFKNLYRIESTRLPNWDYTQGSYFITVCTYLRAQSLAQVKDGNAQLTPMGIIAAEEWQSTASIRSNVTLDAWVVMPDHVHAIIHIYKEHHADQGAVPPRPQLRSGSLGAIVGQWKSAATKRIRAAGHTEFAWQTRFYDVIIRDATMLEQTRQYIDENPRRWSQDQAQKSGVWM